MRESLDQTWFLGFIPQGMAESVYGFVQAALKVDEGVIGPEFIGQFFPRHYLAGAFQQQL